MQKYMKKCWSCGGEDLEPMGDHVKCRGCGATYNPVPQSGSPLVTVESGGGKGDRKYKPSSIVQRRAARARRPSKE